MRTKTILIVEDDQVYRYLVERILRQVGYLTFWTDATNVAWNYVQSGRVDLVVLDVDEVREIPEGPLKRGQGIQFLRQLRESESKAENPLPVVATTSKLPLNMESWRDLCLQQGANVFFEHEFDLDDFVKSVERLLSNETRDRQE